MALVTSPPLRLSNAILLALPLALAVFAAASAHAGLFGPPRNVSLPHPMYFITSGDLNGDGRLDAVAVRDFSDTLYVLLQNSSGAFDAPIPHDFTSKAKDLVCVDVSGDGVLDLLCALDEGVVSINRGHGDGTFEVMNTVPAGLGPFALAIGDLTNDGVLDLVTGNYVDGTVSVLRGLGGGAFAASQDFPAGGDVSHVALGDLNEDNRLDVVAANTSFITVSILLGNGDGTLRPMTQRSVGGDAMRVVIADLNRDHHLDLAVANNLSFASVLLGDGTGGFGTLTQYPVGDGTLAIATADLDGDGRLDLALTNAMDNTVSVLLGRSDGTFAPRMAYATGAQPIEVAVGDFTGDGRPDLITANYEGRGVSVLPNIGTPVNVAGSPNTALSVRAFPNPGSGRIQVQFTLPEAAPTSLQIFDTQGRRVEELVSATLPAGTHAYEWLPRAGRDRAPGVYQCRITSAGRTTTFPLVILE